MRKVFNLLAIVLLTSCNNGGQSSGEKIITVSIAPFKYFVKAIGGNDFTVNIMVPPGSDPHIYEPYPRQIVNLRKSVAYISNGYIGFENAWLGRFYETNGKMRILSLSRNIEPLGSEHKNLSGHSEGYDPHYWTSPRCAMMMSASVRDLLTGLNPDRREVYNETYRSLIQKIEELDKKADSLFSEVNRKAFMIYHPNLAYLARDYGLEEIPLEFEGKEPPPSRVKELIDLARRDRITTLFVQREYDTRNAGVIAAEIGAKIMIIDPLSENWYDSLGEIIVDLYNSLAEGSK